MNRTYVLDKIEAETAACVESRKKGSFLGGFLAPRKKFEPQCRLDARNKYGAELAAAEKVESELKYATDTAFLKEISGDNTQLYITMGIIFTILIIALLIIF